MKPEIGKFQTKVEISLGLGGGKCGIFSRSRKIVARFFGNRKILNWTVRNCLRSRQPRQGCGFSKNSQVWGFDVCAKISKALKLSVFFSNMNSI
jgi:hypothetical protein